MAWDKMTDESKRLIGWGIGVIALFVALFCFWGMNRYDREKMNMSVTVEKVTGNYELTKISKASPFIISVKEETTGITYNDVFISDDCPNYNTKAIVGSKLVLVRYENIKLTDKTKSYVLKGAYEQLCSNMGFNPKSGDNFLNIK